MQEALTRLAKACEENDAANKRVQETASRVLLAQIEVHRLQEVHGVRFPPALENLVNDPPDGAPKRQLSPSSPDFPAPKRGSSSSKREDDGEE